MWGNKDTPEELAKESENDKTVKITKDTIQFVFIKAKTVSYKLDPSKSPAKIDVTVKDKGKDEVLHGIYKVEGDTLTLFIIGTKEAKNRPKEFKTVKPDLKAKKGEEPDVGGLILTLKKKSATSAQPTTVSGPSSPSGKSPPSAKSSPPSGKPFTSKS